LSNQPVLGTDALNHLYGTLAPVEVFLLILQVANHNFVGSRVVHETLAALIIADADTDILQEMAKAKSILSILPTSD